MKDINEKMSRITYTEVVCTSLAALGLVYAIKKLSDYYFVSKSKYKYPARIKFASTGVNSIKVSESEFLEKLHTDHEECCRLIRSANGSECTLTFGDKHIVFLNSIESVRRFTQAGKESSIDPSIGSRPSNLVLQAVSKNYLGSFFRRSDANLKEAQKSTLGALHLLISKNQSSIDVKLSEETTRLLTFLTKNSEKGEAIPDTCVYLQQYITNLALLLSLNVSLPYELDKNAAIKKQIANMNTLLSTINIVDATRMKVEDLKSPSAVSLLATLDDVYKFLTSNVSAYKKEVTELDLVEHSDLIQTFADYVISEQAKKVKSNKGTNLKDDEMMSDTDIMVQLFTLVMATTNTTGFTIMWAFYYLARHKEVQEKLYTEIANVINYNDMSTIQLENDIVVVKQKDKLVYTMATLNEILRLSSTHVFIMRASSPNRDICVDENDYCLPRDTPVMLNLFAIHRDAKYYDKPDEFIPERWIDNSKQPLQLRNIDSFIPFGTAPRICLGKALSINILLSLIVNMVWNYKMDYIQKESDQLTNNKKDGKLGFMRRPYFYDLKLNARQIVKNHQTH